MENLVRELKIEPPQLTHTFSETWFMNRFGISDKRGNEGVFKNADEQLFNHMGKKENWHVPHMIHKNQSQEV